MARLTYIPDRGDLVHAHFSPSAGRELAGPHYALVLSAKSYNLPTGMAVCVPLTSRIRGSRFEVILPQGHLPAKAAAGVVDSAILCDAIRHVDWRERGMAYITKCPKAILDEVTELSLAMIDPQADF